MRSGHAFYTVPETASHGKRSTTAQVTARDLPRHCEVTTQAHLLLAASSLAETRTGLQAVADQAARARAARNATEQALSTTQEPEGSVIPST